MPIIKILLFLSLAINLTWKLIEECQNKKQISLLNLTKLNTTSCLQKMDQILVNYLEIWQSKFIKFDRKTPIILMETVEGTLG